MHASDVDLPSGMVTPESTESERSSQEGFSTARAREVMHANAMEILKFPMAIVKTMPTMPGGTTEMSCTDTDTTKGTQ